MKGDITPESLRDYVLEASDRLTACADELNSLDAKLGDGDLGSTVLSICRALREEITETPDDIGSCFSQIAAAISRTSGSSFSAVAMTGFICAARQTKGQAALPRTQVAALLSACASAMSERGGAKPGDKTLIDGVISISNALEKQDRPDLIQAQALYAMADALKDFRGKPFQVGRARRAQNQGVGCDDPGMTALARTIGITPPANLHEVSSQPDSKET